MNWMQYTYPFVEMVARIGVISAVGVWVIILLRYLLEDVDRKRKGE